MPPRYRTFVSRYDDDDFEWDPDKSAVTFEDRDLAFAAARIAFRGRLLRRRDTRRDYGAPRYQVLGEVYGRVLAIVYTPRGTKCRIISLRVATAVETAIYHDQTD